MVHNHKLLLEGSAAGGQIEQGKTRPTEEIKAMCEMSNEVEALN